MKKHLLIAFAIIVGLIVLDQVTKLLILNYYGGREVLTNCYETADVFCQIDSITIIPGVLSFTFTFNEGGAWGLLFGEMGIFFGITILAFGLFYFLLKDIDLKTKKFYSYAVILMIAGGVGNFIDRLLYHKVTDFIRADFIDFPVFNVADICLVVGVILFAIDVFWEDIIHGKNSRRDTEQSGTD